MHEHTPVLRLPGRPGDVRGRPDEGFDDDVVDFPSMGRAVERMRLPFVAGVDGTMAVSCEITMSAAEARRPQRVALDLPVRSTCRVCGGRGGSWDERCRLCDGSGHHVLRRPVHVALPAAVADGAEFRLAVDDDDARALVHVRVSVISP